MSNLSIALDLALQLTTRMDELVTLFKAASSEGRDLTDEELDSFVAADDAARGRLVAAINRKRGVT